MNNYFCNNGTKINKDYKYAKKERQFLQMYVSTYIVN